MTLKLIEQKNGTYKRTTRTKKGAWNIARAEALLLNCAMLVDRLGPEAQPLLDRAEMEYALLRQPSATERAKKIIADARSEDGLQ
jgi:hypothetical protein